MKWPNVILIVLMGAGFATSAHAVGLVGNYHESFGLRLNLPQNPPLVECDSSPENARCHTRRASFAGIPLATGLVPQVGVPGSTSTVGDPRSTGAPFTLPTGFMRQAREQALPLLGGLSIRFETAFTASAPAAQRGKHLGLSPMAPGYAPNPTTRRFADHDFSLSNPSAFGQNNGLAPTDPDYRFREATTTAFSVSVPHESTPLLFDIVRLSYSGGGFSGTAGLLLDGRADLFVAGSNLDLLGTPAQAPVIFRGQIGDTQAGNPTIRNGVGWDFVTTTTPHPGTFKTFGLTPHDPLPGGFCTTEEYPALPAGCNQVVGFDTYGGTGPIVQPSATVMYHHFPWTTGTVTIIVTRFNAQCCTVHPATTIVGRGHDVVSTTSMGLRRNVGLVAGSYSVRRESTGASQIDVHLAGMNLVFTPEPSSAIALLVGVGLLGGLAARRGRSIRGD